MTLYVWQHMVTRSILIGLEMLHGARYSVAMEEDKITNELLTKLSSLIKSHNEIHPMDQTPHRCMNPRTDKFEEIWIIKDPFGRTDYITLFSDGHYYTGKQIAEYSHKRMGDGKNPKTSNP